MNPRLRVFAYTAAGVILGLVVGVNVANESYGLASLAALLACWLVAKRLSSADPDAWLLASIFVGYVVGNRGFAQVQPSQRIPILPAEAVLVFALPALVVRMVLKRSTGVRRDLLNYAVLVWMAIGALRLPLDLHRYGIMALRDFAMVYYAAFFFVAQAFGGSDASEAVLRKSFTVAFLVLMPVVVSVYLSPDFLLDHLTWRGIPIIYHKSDLIGTSLAAGSFWLWTRWRRTGRRAWIAASVSSLLLIGLMASPRAAMCAVAVTTLLWICAGSWKIAAVQAGSVAGAVVIAVVAIAATGRRLETSIPYSMYEHAISIFDPSGSGSYINGESGNPGDNNRFRMIWWRDVIEDTTAVNPALGLGFGADLATRFLADYDLLSDESFAARSPHSMIVTVFGRMGLVGLAGWIAVSAGIARLVWRLLRRGDPDGMGYGSVAAVIWISACVGVVLEGPMGAVIFWTALGLANARLHRRPPADSALDGRRAQTRTDWPVAKQPAMGSQSLPR